jgi:hypothetical protein
MPLGVRVSVCGFGRGQRDSITARRSAACHTRDKALLSVSARRQHLTHLCATTLGRLAGDEAPEDDVEGHQGSLSEQRR